ncbi:hypothetical protein SELMODRAFT_106726, partial [Selaginella moellendorffii]
VRHAEADHNAGPGFHAGHRIFDPSLKPNGWKQVEQLRKLVEVTGLIRDIELVVVSPLRRALQTAVGVFGVETEPPFLSLNGVASSSSCFNPPLIALELCRELITPYESNKRSPISTCKIQFPMVDFTQIKEDEDVLWHPNVRELKDSLEGRRRAFLQWLLCRKEKNIAVVSHSAFLKNLISKRDETGPFVISDKAPRSR